MKIIFHSDSAIAISPAGSAGRYSGSISVMFNGIADTLGALSQKGCKLGIVTSRIREDFEKEFRRFPIRQYFDIVVCADDTKEHKPTAAPLLKYMELSRSESE